MPLLTKWILTSTFQMFLARQRGPSPRRTSSSRTCVSRWIYRILLRRRFWRRSDHVVVRLPSLQCHRSPLEDFMWWVSSGHRRKQCKSLCEAYGGHYNHKNPNRSLVIQDGVSASETKVFRALALPQGVCGNLIITLALDEPAERWRQSRRDDCGGPFWKTQRKITEERRRLSIKTTWKLSSLETQKERFSEARNVVGPNFLAGFREAIVREGPDE